MSIIKHATNWYGRFERQISSISLVLGFIFDALTIQRIDTAWANAYISAHIILIGLFIILIHTKEKKKNDERDPSKQHFWYVNILQFLFGGILSTCFLSYFRSADIFVTWPFILILATALISNEYLKHHYVRLSFQISLYFLSIYSFAIFLVPVVVHKIGDLVFLFSGVVSLLTITLFIKILFYFSKDKFSKSRKTIYFLISSIFILVNLLYFTRLIPPIPLSLKDAGIYHSIERNLDGNYIVKYEDKGLWGYLDFYKTFKQTSNSSIYAYSAIFSPSKLNINIVHKWERYDEANDEWILESVINLLVIGGRDSGFRTYSNRENLSSGKWRVNVETESGQLIGRLRFEVINVYTKPYLKIAIK